MDNYPMMSASELEMAPWMQEDPQEKSFEVTCSQSLSKTVDVVTNSYNHIVEHELHNRIHEEYDDTSDINWAEEYKKEHLTPLDLIRKLRSLLLDIDSDNLKSNPCYQHKQYYISECSDWIDNETEYIEN